MWDFKYLNPLWKRTYNYFDKDQHIYHIIGANFLNNFLELSIIVNVKIKINKFFNIKVKKKMTEENKKKVSNADATYPIPNGEF